jgi:hypothetical protein
MISGLISVLLGRRSNLYRLRLRSTYAFRGSLWKWIDRNGITVAEQSRFVSPIPAIVRPFV